MAWGHIPRPTRAHYRPDYHSAERHAATKTYSHYTRGQIAGGALGPGTAAAQAAAHKWFSHTAWKNHRDAVVAAHKAARAADRKSAAAQTLGWGVGTSIDSPITRLLGIYAEAVNRAQSDVNYSGMERATRASLGKQRDALWNLVKKEYGGKKPGVKLSYKQGAAGWVGSSHRNVANVEAQIANLASGVNPAERAWLQHVLLHEWAHTRQSPSTFSNKVRSEGGAESYAKGVSSKYGLKSPYRPTDQYRAYMKAVRKQLGPEWIRKGQFK